MPEVSNKRSEMVKRSTSSPAERAELVLRWLSKWESAAQIARRAGVSEQARYRWRDEVLKDGKRALTIADRASKRLSRGGS